MCGIAGLMADRPQDIRSQAAGMAQALAHRGPDAEGVWSDEGAGLAFGHARLSIRDLTPSGAQPMMSASGRFVIAYNGELYNALEMRAQLQDHVWRGTSDTEVLLECCERLGLRETLDQSNGIFAFALWDRQTRTLSLARDRLGVKPLYWASLPGLFLFGSELKALKAHPDFASDLDQEALGHFLRLSYVPAPLSIWRAAKKLLPGHLLTLRTGAAPVIERWWDAKSALQAGLDRQGGQSPEALADELDALLSDAVRRQTVSDVPIGAFLSGGIDSATVVAHLAGQGGRAVDTFTIRYAEPGYDEGLDARRMAEHLGTNHHEKFVTAQDALATVLELPTIYDEPFADSSQIPTLLISRFARDHVTVALSGDGGDEIFAGYNRHLFAARLWPRLQSVPPPLRRLAAGLLEFMPLGGWDRLSRLTGQKLLGEKMQKLAALLPENELTAAHDLLAAQGLGQDESLLADRPASPYLAGQHNRLDALDLMQLIDIETYLPGDVLAKVDRASMSCGLEVRVPLLDHRLIGTAFAAAAKERFALGKGKSLLRRALAKRLPPSLFEGRPKMGFATPIDEWLRGPLKEWASDLLSPNNLRDHPYLDSKLVGRWWHEHQSGRRKRHHALWNLLMFMAWSSANRSGH